MSKLAMAAAVATVLITAARAGAAHPKDPWAKLRRPLHLPQVAVGSACPVTRARQLTSWFGLAQGKGPVYPVGTYPTLGGASRPDRHSTWWGSRWGGNKVLWAIDVSAYRGRVLIRGRQLDGSLGVRFGDGLYPVREMRFRTLPGGTPDGWQTRGSFTRVLAPGCYAWQIDGRTFSRVIIFQAVS